MPSRSSSSSGIEFLDRAKALADVRRSVLALVARRPGIEAVWLFGSLATSRATPRSDADLLIVLREDHRRPMDRAPEFLRLLEGLGRPVDVIVLTADEWTAREGSAFHRAVTGQGLRLHPEI